MANKEFKIQSDTVSLNGVPLSSSVDGKVVIPGVTRATGYRVEEVEDTGDQTQTFATNSEVVVVDAALYRAIVQEYNENHFADFTATTDDEGYIDEIQVNGRGTYNGPEAGLAESANMYVYIGAGSASDRPLVPEDWIQIPFRPKMKSTGIESEFSGSGGGSVERKEINFPQGQDGDTAGTIALNGAGETFICIGDWVQEESNQDTASIVTNQDFLTGQTGNQFIVWSITLADYSPIAALMTADGWQGGQNQFNYSNPAYFTVDSHDVDGVRSCVDVLVVPGTDGYDIEFFITKLVGDGNSYPQGSEAEIAWDIPPGAQPAIWKRLDNTESGGGSVDGLTGNTNYTPENEGDVSYELDINGSIALKVYNAGEGDLGPGISLGNSIGANHRSGVIAIGNDDVGFDSKQGGIYIGAEAGWNDSEAPQGEFAIAIGTKAARNITPDNSITLNATGEVLDPTSSGLFIKPIREEQYDDIALYYDPTTGEVTYATNSGSSASAATISETAPELSNGRLWFNSTEGRMYIKYDGQWVDASPTVLAPPETDPTFASVTFNDGTIQTSAFVGTAVVNKLTNGTHELALDSNGDIVAPGDVVTVNGRFIHDCNNDSGTTSIRWINIPEGNTNTQLLRAYTGDANVERAQIEMNWQDSVQSGLTIKSFNDGYDRSWKFRGDGKLEFPDGTKQTSAALSGQQPVVVNATTAISGLELPLLTGTVLTVGPEPGYTTEGDVHNILLPFDSGIPLGTRITVINMYMGTVNVSGWPGPGFELLPFQTVDLVYYYEPNFDSNMWWVVGTFSW